MKVACSVACMIQITVSIYNQVDPKETVAKTTTKTLGDIDFPAAFKVCMKPGFKGTELVNVGYASIFHYFSGRSRYEKNFTGMGYHGWAGHTEDGEVFSNVSDVQDRIFQDYQSVIKYTALFTNKVSWGSIPSSSYKLRIPNYPNNCLTLDVNEHLKPGEILYGVSITFASNLFATDVDVIIEDRLTYVDRIRQYTTRKELINYDSLGKNLKRTYLVSFKQNVYLVEDNTVCVNYPNDMYESFNDCDLQHLDKLLQKTNLYPAWATPEDLSKATNLTKSNGLVLPAVYFTGLDPSPCIQPCTQTSIKAIYQYADKDFENTNPTITLNFNPYVEVTTHAWPRFQPVEVLQVHAICYYHPSFHLALCVHENGPPLGHTHLLNISPDSGPGQLHGSVAGSGGGPGCGDSGHVDGQQDGEGLGSYPI